jgi:transcriptional regulator with XRE-family HTH domain
LVFVRVRFFLILPATFVTEIPNMVERIRTLLESRQLTPTQFADVIGVARPIVSHILSGRNKPSLEVVQRILAAMPDLAMPWLLNGTGPMLAGATATGATATGTSAPPEAAGPAVAPIAHGSVATPAIGLAAMAAHPVLALGSEYAEQQAVSVNIPQPTSLRANAPVPTRNRIAPKRFVANAVSSEALLPAQDVAAVPPAPPAMTATLPPAVAMVPDTAAGPPVSSATLLSEVPPATTEPLPMPADEASGAALASALFAGGDKPIRRIVIFYRDGSFADYQPE